MQPALQHAAEKAVFGGREVPFYGWHYPPFFFAVAVLVAAVPYALGPCDLAGGELCRLSGGRCARSCRGPRRWLIAAAFPAVFVNIGHGQNGFLTAALLGGALHWLDRRPWLAGVLIGCLAYKPQFGVLIPVALLAGGRWSTIAAAAATVAALVAVSFATLGGGVWHAFADSIELHADRGARTGRHRLGEDSIDLLGGADVGRRHAAWPMPRRSRWRCMLAACLAWLWRSDAAFELKASALASGSLLATPYVLDYDLVVLAVAIAYLARHGLRRGFEPFEISLLAAAWLVPLLSRGVAGVSGIPLGLAGVAADFRFHHAACGRGSRSAACECLQGSASVI